MTSSSPSSWWKIATRVHGRNDGYWGPVDANHQFCEPHYTSTIYLAECWNAFSSLAYCVMAAYLYYFNPRLFVDDQHRRHVSWMCGWLAIIGLGSFLFHGTMRRSMQFLDEGPMVGLITTSILWKVDKQPQQQKHSSWRIGIRIPSTHPTVVRCFFGGLGVSLVVLYAWLDCYELFVHGFAALCVVDQLVLTTDSCNNKKKKKNEGGKGYRQKGIVLILIGKVLWEVENRGCEAYPSVWPLHVLWHFLSAGSAYCLVIYNASLSGAVRRKLE